MSEHKTDKAIGRIHVVDIGDIDIKKMENFAALANPVLETADAMIL